MGRILGWVNVFFVFSLFLPFLLSIINKSVKINLSKYIKVLFKIHPFLFLSLLISITIHFYLVLGVFILHTGTIAFIAILLTGLLQLISKSFKLKINMKVHKQFAYLSSITIIIHIVYMKFF